MYSRGLLNTTITYGGISLAIITREHKNYKKASLLSN